MGDEDNTADRANGEVVTCSSCRAPVVLAIDRGNEYRLVCGCPNTAVGIDEIAASSSLFTPLSGKWSQLDDPDHDDSWHPALEDDFDNLV